MPKLSAYWCGTIKRSPSRGLERGGNWQKGSGGEVGHQDYISNCRKPWSKNDPKPKQHRHRASAKARRRNRDQTCSVPPDVGRRAPLDASK